MGSHIPEPRSTRGRGNAPETGRGAEPGESRECSSKPPRNPRPSERGGGQIRLVNEFSNLHLILIVSFPNENWIYEILAALQGSEDLTRVLLKNRDQIIRYCDEQPVEASSTRINAIEEALMRNASCH
ncbi:MAG: hypothetical protein QXY67_02165 [Zestosphaera sp.]